MQRLKWNCCLIFVLYILLTNTNAEPDTVVVMFSSTATLPCFGYGENQERTYIYWKTDTFPVFLYDKANVELGAGFEQRADIPRDQISEGNFSLTIRSTKFSDAGLYRCYCSQPSYEHRLCRIVHLVISGHEDHPMLMLGEDLWISLYTQEPVTVEFEDSALVCAVEGNRVRSPGPRFEERLLLNDRKLKLCAVTSVERGKYKVKDHQGNVINSVTLTLKTQDSVVNHWKAKSMLVFLIVLPIVFCICTIFLFDYGFQWSLVCKKIKEPFLEKKKSNTQSSVTDSQSTEMVPMNHSTTAGTDSDTERGSSEVILPEQDAECDLALTQPQQVKSSGTECKHPERQRQIHTEDLEVITRLD